MTFLDVFLIALGTNVLTVWFFYGVWRVSREERMGGYDNIRASSCFIAAAPPLIVAAILSGWIP